MEKFIFSIIGLVSFFVEKSKSDLAIKLYATPLVGVYI